MADQRPFSRFRLPWLSAVTAPQPQLQPQTTRPLEILAPPQPQRPPFRPAGITQVQQSTQPLATLPPSQTPAVTESLVGSQPTSPTQATTPARANSVPPSPSRATTQAKAASLSSSPSREPPAAYQTRSASRAAPLPRPASVPPSPTRTTTQPQPTPQTIPPLSSSLPQFLPSISQPTQFPPSSTQQAPKPAVSLQEAAEKVKAAEQGKRDAEMLKAKELSAQTKEDKKTITTVSSGEQIKTISSIHTKLRKKAAEAHQKPGMPNGEQLPLQKEIKDDITKFVHKLATGQLQYPMDDKPVSIVTIAGENKGAFMHLVSEPVRKEGSVHIHRSYKLSPDESIGTTTDAEEIKEGKKLKNPTKEAAVKKAFLNSNTQSINNSMFLESSVNEVSPGMHLVVSQNLPEPINSEPLETHKAEINVTHAQKLTYDPTIRRRCLRGLFLESSDSDPDNPEKPRRHGCRYYCRERSKD